MFTKLYSVALAGLLFAVVATALPASQNSAAGGGLPADVDEVLAGVVGLLNDLGL